MRAHHLALRALNAVAIVHAPGELIGLLFVAPRLQRGVVLSDHQRAMGLSFADALASHHAIAAMRAPLKAVTYLTTRLLLEPTALRVLMTGRTDRSALFDAYIEAFRAGPTRRMGARPCRSH